MSRLTPESAPQASAIRQVLGSTEFVNELLIGMILHDTSGKVIDCNESFAALLGVARDDFLGRTLDDPCWGMLREDGTPFTHDELPSTITIDTGASTRGVVMGTGNARQVRHWFLSDTSPVTLDDGTMGAMSTFTEITDRIKSRRLLRLVNEMSHTMMFSASEGECLERMCAALVDTGKYALAWIGEVSRTHEGGVDIVCSSGRSDYLYEGMVTWWGSLDSGRGPAGTALRDGVTQVRHELAGDALFDPWRDRAREYRLGAVVVIPFALSGRSAIVTIYDENIMGFDPETVLGLEEVVRQAQFGIEHQKSVQAAQSALVEATRANVALRNAEQSLIDSREWFRLVLTNSSDVVLVVNRDAEIIYSTPSKAEGGVHYINLDVGADFFDGVHPDDRDAVHAQFERASREPGTGPSHTFRVRDQRRVWRSLSVVMTNCLDESVIGGVVVNAHDVTENVLASARLEESEYFLESITDNMVEGLMALDHDGIVTYANASAGRLLKWNPSAMVGRPAHETFHHVKRDGSPFPVDECPIQNMRESGESVSVDQDFFVQRTGSFLPVAYNATALRTPLGNGVVYVFEDISEKIAERERIDGELEKLNWVGRNRDALDNNRFVLYAQPIVELSTMKPVQHELLIRMIGANGESILPAKFLPSAEEYGLIAEIDRWVIRQTMDLALAGHKVEFNLSAHSVADPRTLAYIERQLENTNAPPENLVCEVTETALVRDMTTAEALVNGLNTMGIKVALDDFGSGYGGFAYLKKFPVSYLKIDREFIKDLVDEASSRHVVRAVANLARAFSLETVAEGAEDVETLDVLRELGIDHVQGYVVARPAPVSDVFSR